MAQDQADCEKCHLWAGCLWVCKNLFPMVECVAHPWYKDVEFGSASTSTGYAVLCWLPLEFLAFLNGEGRGLDGGGSRREVGAGYRMEEGGETMIGT